MHKTTSIAILLATSALPAQEPPSEQIAVPGTDAVVRITADGRSAVSRDGARTWIQLPAVDHTVRIRDLAFDPATRVPMPVSLGAPPDNELFLVQFVTDVLPEYRVALQRMGALVTYYVPNQTCLVRMKPDLRKRVLAQPFVRTVADFHVAYRLEPEIVSDLASGVPMHGRFNIVMVDQTTDAEPLEHAILATGGEINRHGEGGILVEATLSDSQLRQVVVENTVLWIDRAGEPEVDVDPRIQTGVTYLQSLADIDGKGVRGHIFEGVHASHPEFAARPPYRTAPIWLINGEPSEHGTNQAGLVFAQGLQVTGMLPFGQMLYTHFPGVNRFALARELVDPAGIYQAMFQTAAWGSPRTTQYTSRSADIDNTLFHFDLFYTQSQSNAGGPPSRPEAWAKNGCGIGGFLHLNNTNPGDDCWCNSGSTGPAADGRVGVSFTSYFDGVATTSGSSGYNNMFTGTSAATPIVAGAAGLAMQIFGDGHVGYPAVPSNAAGVPQRFATKPHLTTVRVMVAATSRQLSFTGARKASRFQQGWGYPHLGDLWDLRDNLLVLDEEDVLQQGQKRTYVVYVKPGTPEFRASMHHLEPQAAPQAIPTRVNSLDLQVIDPTGQIYWGNDPGLLSGPTSSPGGVPNDVDIHENVFLQNPIPGVHQVTVRATAVRQDTHLETAEVDVDFALAVRGIGGGRDRSGMLLDLISTQPGQFDVSLTGVPATGWQAGYTLMSVNTSRHASLGNLFGLEVDPLTLGIASSPPVAGNVFAFTSTTNPGLFPNARFRFPAALATLLSGVTLDGVAMLVDGTGQVVSVSNVDRVVIR